MINILLGALGFPFILLFDLMLLKKVARLRFLVWMTGMLLMVYSLVTVNLHPDRIAPEHDRGDRGGQVHLSGDFP